VEVQAGLVEFGEAACPILPDGTRIQLQSVDLELAESKRFVLETPVKVSMLPRDRFHPRKQH